MQKFLDCGTFAFRARYKSCFEGKGNDDSSASGMEAKIAPLTVES
jgi:hypothetical protein